LFYDSLYIKAGTGATITTNIVGKSTTSAIINVNPLTVYELYVTAYNPSGLESDPSNKIRYTSFIVNGFGKITPITLLDSSAANYPMFQLIYGPTSGLISGTAPSLVYNPTNTFIKDSFAFKSPEMFQGTNVMNYYSVYKVQITKPTVTSTKPN
jgi:hypothetical protein